MKIFVLISIIIYKIIAAESVIVISQRIFDIRKNKQTGEPACNFGNLIYEFPSSDKVECSSLCGQTDDCIAFNYKKSNNTCVLFNDFIKIVEVNSLCFGFYIPQIEIPENVTLCKDTTNVNLALYKKVYASSVYPGWLPEYLTDGSNYFFWPSCASTLASPSEWFLVDLVGTYLISNVVLYNRCDGSNWRISNVIIGVMTRFNETVGLKPDTYPLCGKFLHYSTHIRRIEITCSDVTPPGRFLSLQLPHPAYYDPYLNLCEILVFGNCICPNNTLTLDNNICYCPLAKSYPLNKVTQSLSMGRAAYSSNGFSEDACTAVDGSILTGLDIVYQQTSVPVHLLIDLVEIYYVERIVYWNAPQTQNNNITDIYVGVKRDHVIGSSVGVRAFPLCIHFTSNYNSMYNFTCANVLAGRNVIIQQVSNKTFSLMEIQIFGMTSKPVNLALGKPIRASSVYSAVMKPENLVDGDISALIGSYCAATGDWYGGPNWFVVDLKEIYTINKVALWNRDDGASYRLSYVIVGVTNEFLKTITRFNYPLCSQFNKISNNIIRIDVNCSIYTPPGRYVIVQQPIHPAVDGFLNLCEIMIYGDIVCANKTNFTNCFCPLYSGYPQSITSFTGLNLALGRAVFMSSGNNSCRAVDGNSNRNATSGFSCTSTDVDANSQHWICVHLSGVFIIDYVTFVNQDIRPGVGGAWLSYVTIGLRASLVAEVMSPTQNMSLCATTDFSSYNLTSFNVTCESPKPRDTKYVVVVASSQQNQLALCELEVYGKKFP